MSKRNLTIIVLLLAGIAAAYWYNQNPPDVTMINPDRPPEPIPEKAEVQKLSILQNSSEVYLLGGISPYDTTVIVAAGAAEVSSQAFWLNIQTGDFEPIDSKFLELFPQSELTWFDDQTAIYISNNANSAPVLVTVRRAVGEIETELLQISGRVLSLSPDGSRLLIESGNQTGMELALLDLETRTTEILLRYSAGNGPLSILPMSLNENRTSASA